MSGIGDASVTIRQEGNQGPSKETVPVLLVVGDARKGGAFDGPRLMLVPPSLEIGRARDESGDADKGRLGLPDKLLSRVHLRLERLPGGCDVEDAGSLNGTFVDGRRLAGRQRLADGNLLLFGSHAAVFRRVSEEVLGAIGEDLAGPFGPVATTSPTLASTIWRLRRLARSGSGVLITGETGVGKEVYARAVHRASKRTGRMVAINCAAIPSELAESELFGYSRGAHSTANESKTGLIEAADGGTLFLDEIGDMNPRLQAKMLRFLQEREVTPLGTTTPRKVDVQVIAATSQAGASELRSDLAARLGAQPIRIPPLRERIEDLGVLIHHFLAEGGRTPPEIEPAAFHALCHYGWPRNVRELQKVIGEAVALSEGAACLRLPHLPEVVTAVMEPSSRTTETPGRRPTPSKTELELLLQEHGGNVAQVARALDRQWAVVWRWIGKYGIDPERYRK